jgi:hypothetical protein
VTISSAEAVVDKVGTTALGHLTPAGQVIVRPPVASWIILKSILVGPEGAVNVKVQLPVMVMYCLLPLVQSMVLVVPELPILYSD